ncbi:MAG: hypothetical protein AAGH65_09515, partial [Pseudomonadota bacterium]
EIGSTVPEVQQAAAKTLLMVLDNAQDRLEIGYGRNRIPALKAHFEAARVRLETMQGTQPRTAVSSE